MKQGMNKKEKEAINQGIERTYKERQWSKEWIKKKKKQSTKGLSKKSSDQSKRLAYLGSVLSSEVQVRSGQIQSLVKKSFISAIEHCKVGKILYFQYTSYSYRIFSLASLIIHCLYLFSLFISLLHISFNSYSSYP